MKIMFLLVLIMVYSCSSETPKVIKECNSTDIRPIPKEKQLKDKYDRTYFINTCGEKEFLFATPDDFEINKPDKKEIKGKNQRQGVK